jgi:hypothetical protein
MKAYKVFNPDWTCRSYQFEVGKTYEENVKPELCNRGFHACKNIADCFSYYSFDPNNKVAEVELIGDIVGVDEDKQATNKIKIVRELSWNEVLELANSGKGNTGLRNSGDSNSGNSNSGYRNSGDRNSGDRNSGNRNSGNSNSGDFNSNTPEEIRCFNKPCNRIEWDNAPKPSFIYDVVLNKWICFDYMTDEEKARYPKAFVCDGYLKTYSYKEAWKIAFDNRNSNDIELLKALPNFDAVVFEEITGIEID